MQDQETTSIFARPIYRHFLNSNFYLATASIKFYPLPWIMWGGPYHKPGDETGNLKFGYNVPCPEDTKVGFLHFLLIISQIFQQVLYSYNHTSKKLEEVRA